MYTLTTTYTTW